MKTKRTILCGLLAVILALALTGCPPEPDPDDGHTHTYATAWSFNATQHWHECTANDGAKKGAAKHSSDPCKVCGYDSTATLVTFSGLSANGSATATTTTLTLTFSAAIAGLSASDITLSVAGAQKGALSGAGPTYTLPISGFTAGGTLSVTVSKIGYNISGSPKTVTIYYYSGGNPIPTTREVTIAMWDSGSDGWDNSAALRINVNGTDRPNNASVSTTAANNTPSGQRSANTYTFDVNSGDVVQIYWVSGGQYDNECAFAAYYTDDPPNPMFNPSSGTTDTARVLASKRYNNPTGAVGGGTSMGSFTVGGGANPGDITYTAASNSTTNTTAITLTFSAAVTDLAADDITVANGTGSVTTGALTGSGASWTLAVTVGATGNVTVSINKTGIESGSKPVTVYSMNDAIPLTENVWTDGSIATSSDVQWFTFTATAPTQYLHADFGTLGSVYVQVYDSGGTAVGSETNLSSYSSSSTSRTLISEQTYYIRVRPYSSSYRGTYRIAFNASTTAPPVELPTNAIPLTANQWADGSIPSSSGNQWFTFTATASTQYIYVAFGTLEQLYVQVYDNSGGAVGSETRMYGFSTNTDDTSRSLSSGQTYYIRVRPYNSNYSGTYRIAFNASTTAPPVAPSAIPLTTANQWTDGNITTAGGEQWFVFTATATTRYIQFSTTGTLKDVYVMVYNSSGGPVGSEARMYSSTRNTSKTLTEGQTYYIRVRPYSSSGSGTYRIGFNALTANQWADGYISSGSEQRFTFTATATTQYIHFSPGTLTSVYVQVYVSSGAAVGSRAQLSDTTSSSSRTSISLTVGQTYNIGVTPYGSSIGSFRIAFNTSAIAPN